MERRFIKASLLTCGFKDPDCRDFIVGTEFGTWRSFYSVDPNVFATLRGRLAGAGFDCTAIQMLNLSVLKFYVEDKHRMKEYFTSNDFKREIQQYFTIYQDFLTAKSMSHTIPIGPKFSVDGWYEFSLGTERILQSILGDGGAPLSHVIRNNKVRPHISGDNTRNRHIPRSTKIYWKAPMRGTVFDADNRRVWTYLLQQCQDTPGLIRIQRYRNDGREAWLALCRNHGVENNEPPDDPSYEDDDYTYINHKLRIYKDIYDRWHRAELNGHRPMMSEMLDLEREFFTASKYRGLSHGFNMNHNYVCPESLRERARRPTSSAPSILHAESLVVSVKRACELLQPVGMIRPFARMVLRTYEGMRIVNNHDLHLTLRPTKNDPVLKQEFVRQFQFHNEYNHELSELEISFFRSTAHYMNQQWDSDHEYFQRMIERDARTNPDMNIELGMAEGNPQMIALGIQQVGWVDDRRPGPATYTQHFNNGSWTTETIPLANPPEP